MFPCVCLSLPVGRASCTNDAPHFSLCHESDHCQGASVLGHCPLLLNSQWSLRCSQWALGWLQLLVRVQHSFLPRVFCLFPNPKSLSLPAPLPSTLAASIMPCPGKHSPLLLHLLSALRGVDWPVPALRHLQGMVCSGSQSPSKVSPQPKQAVAELRPSGQLPPLNHSP